MIKGLTEYEKYKVIRPVIGDCTYDHYGMPILKKQIFQLSTGMALRLSESKMLRQKPPIRTLL